jgi:ATP-dependent DNA ligase
MVTFDIASLDLQEAYFEDRYRILLSVVRPDHAFLVIITFENLSQNCTSNQYQIVVSRAFCSTKQHLTLALQSQIDNGGEGVILRKPGSFYTHGRTALLLKLKVYFPLFFPSALSSFRPLAAIVKQLLLKLIVINLSS